MLPKIFPCNVFRNYLIFFQTMFSATTISTLQYLHYMINLQQKLSNKNIQKINGDWVPGEIRWDSVELYNLFKGARDCNKVGNHCSIEFYFLVLFFLVYGNYCEAVYMSYQSLFQSFLHLCCICFADPEEKLWLVINISTE